MHFLGQTFLITLLIMLLLTSSGMEPKIGIIIYQNVLFRTSAKKHVGRVARTNVSEVTFQVSSRASHVKISATS